MTRLENEQNELLGELEALIAAGHLGEARKVLYGTKYLFAYDDFCIMMTETISTPLHKRVKAVLGVLEEDLETTKQDDEDE